MKYSIVIYSGDTETVWNAFRFANTALGYENEVTVFLLGSGVEAPTLSTLAFDIEEQIKIFRKAGGKMIGCGVCCDYRRLEMPLLQGQLNCERGSMQQLYVLINEANKILTF